MIRRFLLVSIISLLSVASYGARTSVSESAQPRSLCDPNPPVANLNFTLKDMNGKPVALSAHKGRVLLLDFWATWCAACKIEIPNFVELGKRYSSMGLVVVGVSVDDPPSKLRSFAKEFRMNYPVLVGDGRKDLMEAFGSPEAFPTTFVISRDGKVCRAHAGYTPKEQIEREIRSLL